MNTYITNIYNMNKYNKIFDIQSNYVTIPDRIDNIIKLNQLQ